MFDDGQRARHLVEVVQRLAHAHEDDIRRFLPVALHRPVELLHHLASAQVAAETEGRGGAEGAAPGAADLAGNAQGQLAALLLVVGDEHGFDRAVVVGAEAELARAVRGYHRPVESQRHERRIGEKRVAQGARHRRGCMGNAHATHAARARAVQPAEELLSAERQLTRARHALAKFRDGERSEIQARGL
jgi:hypothetical protein